MVPKKFNFSADGIVAACKEIDAEDRAFDGFFDDLRSRIAEVTLLGSSGMRKLLRQVRQAEGRLRFGPGWTRLFLALESRYFEDSDGWTPLHWAAIAGHLGALDKRVLARDHLLARNSNGDTPLHLAANGGKLDGIDVAWFTDELLDSENADGRTVMCLAFTGPMNGLKSDSFEWSKIPSPILALARQRNPEVFQLIDSIDAEIARTKNAGKGRGRHFPSLADRVRALREAQRQLVKSLKFYP